MPGTVKKPTPEEISAAEKAAKEQAQQFIDLGEPAPTLPEIPSGSAIPDDINYT